MNPKYTMHEYVQFTTPAGGKRVGEIISIYLPPNDTTWRYGIMAHIFKPNDQGRNEKIESFYTYSEAEINV